jgi:hypothetical protein
VVLERPLLGGREAGELTPDRQVWPPPPHDPRDRELAMRLGEWEVRLFGDRKFQYFVTRGFWHVQLWHEEARLSVLSPSRLTRGFYEAYPIANWKAQAPDYERLISLIASTHVATLPSPAEIKRVERALVDDVVRSNGRLVS